MLMFKKIIIKISITTIIDNRIGKFRQNTDFIWGLKGDITFFIMLRIVQLNKTHDFSCK